MNPSEFTQQHAPDGVLTSEQASQLLELAMEGDTGAGALESGGEPGATPGAEEGQQGAQASENVENNGGAAEPEIDPEKAVVLAKDNVHTIPYQKLIDAREGEKHWKGQATEAQAQLQEALQKLDALNAQAQQRSDAGSAPTTTDQQAAAATAALEAGVDPAIFGDFSEEAIARGVQQLTKLEVRGLQAELAELKAALKPLQEVQRQIQQQSQSTAVDAHFKALDDAHADWESVVESKELADWIASQPSFTRNGFNAVLEKGTAGEVIELLDTFKQATGRTQAGAGAQGVQAAAKKAIASAQALVPASLSDFPGGRVGPATGNEALANLNAVDLLETLDGRTPEQIEAYLNRNG